jgi:hypothetical protein
MVESVSTAVIYNGILTLEKVYLNFQGKLSWYFYNIVHRFRPVRLSLLIGKTFVTYLYTWLGSMDDGTLNRHIFLFVDQTNSMIGKLLDSLLMI